jgi:hypothetical protein
MSVSALAPDTARTVRILFLVAMAVFVVTIAIVPSVAPESPERQVPAL